MRRKETRQVIKFPVPFENITAVRQGSSLDKWLFLDSLRSETTAVVLEWDSKTLEMTVLARILQPFNSTIDLVGCHSRTGDVFLMQGYRVRGDVAQFLWHIHDLHHSQHRQLPIVSGSTEHTSTDVVSVVIHLDGTIYWTERYVHCIYTTDPTSMPVTKRVLAGDGSFQSYGGFEDSQCGLDARFDNPTHLSFSPDGKRLLCCDTVNNNALRIIDLVEVRHPVSTLVFDYENPKDFPRMHVDWTSFDAAGRVALGAQTSTLRGARRVVVWITIGLQRPDVADDTIGVNEYIHEVSGIDVDGSIFTFNHQTLELVRCYGVGNTNLQKLVDDWMTAVFDNYTNGVLPRGVWRIVAEYSICPHPSR